MVSLRGRDLSWGDRFLPIPGLTATTAICCTLLALQQSGWRGTSGFADYVTKDRTTTAIVVQVVSHVLGSIQVLVLCTVLRSSFMVALKTRPFSLHLADFIHDATIPRLSFALPWFFSMSLAVLVAFSLIPGALWSGALTPIISEKTTRGSVEVPHFPPTSTPSDLLQFWTGDNATSVTGGGPYRTWMNEKGTFSFDPATIHSLIINSAAQSSTGNATGSFHQKLDKTGYSYVNRSYGIGAAAGLVDVGQNLAPTWYEYNETGFAAQASCAYNHSMNFTFDRLSDSVAYFSPRGQWPDGETFGGWQYIGYTPQDILGWTTQYSNVTSSMSLIMRTAADQESDAWGFLDFDQTQCDFTFVPRRFKVTVNNTNNVIQVHSYQNETVEWPPYGHEVLSQISMWMWHLSFRDSSVGGSELGRSLRLNANQMQKAASNNSTALLMRSVEKHVTSCWDNIMVHLLSTRIVAKSKDATTSVNAIVAIPAVAFGGDPRYLYGILSVNFMILIIYLVEMIRNRTWKDMHSVEFSSISSVILGFLRGELAVADSEIHQNAVPLKRRSSSMGKSDVHGFNVPNTPPADDNVQLRLVNNRSRGGIRHGYASLISRYSRGRSLHGTSSYKDHSRDHDSFWHTDSSLELDQLSAYRPVYPKDVTR